MQNPDQVADQTRTLRRQVQQGLDDVHTRIADACKQAGRSTDAVALVAVTKYAPMDAVEALIDLGQQDLGESYVQQLTERVTHVDHYLSRQQQLLNKTTDPVRWHMIGHLQRNKVKQAAPACSLIHGVDTLRLGKEISTWGQKRHVDMHILMQVNTSQEDSKHGCPPAAATALARELARMPGICLRGLMTMAAPSDNPENARPCFARTRELFDDCLKEGEVDPATFNLLSMGMSGDFEQAILEGSNVIRAGSAIFAHVPK